MSGGRRAAILTVIASAGWYACVLTFWAMHPLSDSVPVGVDYTRKPPAAISMSVPCNTLFESASRGAVPPALKPQPESAPPLAYQRDPCGLVHGQARIVFAFDSALMLSVMIGTWWLLFWRPRPFSEGRNSTSGSPVAAQAA